MNKQVLVPDALTLLAANVLKLRLQMGISQEKLAEMAGFHRTYMSQVERCIANPTVRNVQKIATILAVPVAKLFEVPKGN
jgi:transcriptional regulator with XRE-family HTH domain